MILTDNIIALKKRGGLYEDLKSFDEQLDSAAIKAVETPSGNPTLTVEREGGAVYLHSKYDPVKEAEGFIERLDHAELASADHIFFYGAGMGYHVEALMKRYPKTFFTIYEPDPYAFCHYLSHRRLDDLPLKSLNRIFVEINPNNIELFAFQFFSGSHDKIFFVTLPSYERIYKEQFEGFTKHFKLAVHASVSNRSTSYAFEKRWTINSMINFGENLRNGSIFRCNREHIKGKPAIMVGAGPSLEFELENLRRISAEGLAYIVPIGSAIKALIVNDIMPHATVTMDPHTTTQTTFQELIEREIDTVPLIYATSVGHEATQIFPGPKKYMVLDKDTVSPFYLQGKGGSAIEIVNDAPSVATTAMQALLLLGFDPVIMVGQNLGFIDNQNYAKSIQYGWRDHMATEGEKTGEMTVEDVEGNEMATSAIYNLLRLSLEGMIARFPGRRVINTTRRGAKVAGATYVTLDELLETELTKAVVEPEWYVPEKVDQYELKHLIKRDSDMRESYAVFRKQIERAADLLRRINTEAAYNRPKKLDELYHSFDSCFRMITKNDFFNCILLQMNRIEHGVLGSNLAHIRAERDMQERARLTVGSFDRLLSVCERDMKFVEPLFRKIHEDIEEFVRKEEERISEKTSEETP